ncbi:SDR family oxidoreductase [Polynucleobacter sp. MWH-UH25E]|uniref:dTDP-4-dehydrorhamnose reductase family protein n=1 Tax=Polynucleobacter sp. MWH-UH25E TaxID=1855616 RepID=UPI001BFDC8DB|nr:SDR family oxidoreductase [Polynucleobacter sp. MWH-UH25E]QWD62368.1 SDR family oxidoreductase [Polynucleobacter sp. MWH-UH25E]
MRILVLGTSGMIGSAVFKILSEDAKNQVFGSIRDIGWKSYFSQSIQGRIINDVDVMSSDDLIGLFEQTKPNVIINCIGLTKHKHGSENPLVSLPINSLFPHRLAHLCKLVGARLIHISTDCVFSGERGDYSEGDHADASDIYGRSKALGEVDYPNTITLRTSTIGHEIQTRYGLLDWFLSQGESCKGFAKAIFSGLPTVVFAQIIRDVVIPHDELTGLYHVAAKPINKFELLGMIARCYQKDIEIIRDDSFRIDRSLNSDRFRLATGYEPPEWPELIKLMHAYQ